MAVGPFLKRELVVSVRRGAAMSERRAAVILMAVVLGGWGLAWDWNGWDRASVRGASKFARSVFGWAVGVQALLGLGYVMSVVASGIPSERDRKSLDSLLATRLSAADVVLGTMAAGLLRCLNGLAALVPVVTLLVVLGGIEPRLVGLAALGIASTAVMLASISVVVSASARSKVRAESQAVALMMVWLCLPAFLLMILPKLWPSAVRWVAPVAVRVLDSSPMVVVFSLAGVTPRGPLVEVVLRMVAWQVVASALLVTWAIARLRPASRAVYDAEGRIASRRSQLGRWWRRPACGDDPVLWREMLSRQRSGPLGTLVDMAVHTAWIGLLAYAVSLVALPAFAELARDGYGPAPAGSRLPELNPMAQILVGKWMGMASAPAPGQARLEFNLFLRHLTAILGASYVLGLGIAAAESVAVERERETWLGLIATPLSGREILRAKILGVIWRTRGLAILVIVLWSVGLLAGVVHPIGFLAALWGMVTSVGFVATAGVAASLWSRNREQASSRSVGTIILWMMLAAVPFLWPVTAAGILAVTTGPVQTWVSLLSYEDVRDLARASPVAPFAMIGVRSEGWSRVLLAAWLVSTLAQAVGAVLLARAAVLGFDAAVGRPLLPRRGEGGVGRAEDFGAQAADGRASGIANFAVGLED